MIDQSPDHDAAVDNDSATPATAISTSARISLVLAAVVIPTAVAVGAYALFRHGASSSQSASLPAPFQLELDQQFEIPESMIGYVQRVQIPLALDQPRALAVGTDNRIYVAGDQTIHVLDPDGRLVSKIKLETEPTCLAVASDDADEPGRLYIGTAQGVLIYGPDGTAQGAWPVADEKSELTAIAMALDEVFVADAGHRLVLRYAADGRLLGQIGATSPDRQMPGFVIPSPYFDLVVGPDMFLYVVNPGARRVECYTFDGQLQGYWGHAGSGLTDFFGCCNPAHLARLPDGRFVTSEKGIPRIKIYSAVGDFETVVAGPAQLDVPSSALGDARSGQSHRIFDVATNQHGEVLALDTHNRCIRIFAVKESSATEATPAPKPQGAKSS